MASIFQEFKEFVKEFKVIGGAVAFIIALAVRDLTNSLVTNMINPILNVFVPQEVFNEAVWQVGPIAFKIGAFISSVIEFLVILAVIFLMVRYVLRWDLDNKK